MLDKHKLALQLSTRKASSAVKAQKRTAPEKQSTKLVVRNVAFEATRKDVMSLFSPFGHMKSCRLPRKFDGTPRYATAVLPVPHEAVSAWLVSSSRFTDCAVWNKTWCKVLHNFVSVLIMLNDLHHTFAFWCTSSLFLLIYDCLLCAGALPSLSLSLSRKPKTPWTQSLEHICMEDVLLLSGQNKGTKAWMKSGPRLLPSSEERQLMILTNCLPSDTRLLHRTGQECSCTFTT